MERYMYQDDLFERMLKQKADEYRMYPSNQTWDNIQKQVQKKNNLLNFKSIGLTVVLLTTFSLYLSNHQESYVKLTISSVQKDLNQTETTQQPTVAAAQVLHKITKSYKPQIKAVAEIKLEGLMVDKPTVTAITIEQKEAEAKITEPVVAVVEQTAVEELLIQKVTNDHLLSSSKPELSTTSPEQKTTIISTEQNSDPAATEESPSLKTDAELNYEVNIPVVIKVKAKRQLQLYVTPSASYRVLYANNTLNFGNLPQQDPENAVTHMPALGLEAGATILFPVSKKINFIAGLQFNHTQYKLNAFKTNPQLTTVRLNYSSIQRITSLNNDYGFFSKQVVNETYQISIPLGVEITLAGKNKLHWNIASTLQPTYLLNASGYLLTNDLKNYIKAPDLLSHLNLNTSLETFIRWGGKNFQLQAGPQLRYQLFSNVRGEYPIREHLIDYGFRIGIVKPLR